MYAMTNRTVYRVLLASVTVCGRMKHYPSAELTAPMIGQHGRPDAQGQLVMVAIGSQSRRRRMATTFVALVASGLRREVAATRASDFHDGTLGFVVTILECAGDRLRKVRSRACSVNP